ncbi:MAG: hypothetical protein Q9213_002970 [Squamulea squamosa]
MATNPNIPGTNTIDAVQQQTSFYDFFYGKNMRNCWKRREEAHHKQALLDSFSELLKKRAAKSEITRALASVIPVHVQRWEEEFGGLLGLVKERWQRCELSWRSIEIRMALQGIGSP